MGYGKMSKGEYNGCDGKGSYKSFGSKGQGWTKEGVKDDNSADDEPRTMLVTIPIAIIIPKVSVVPFAIFIPL